MTRISVLLSVRNGAETLPRALDSIIAQSFTAWELVVINDGSTDGTAEILDQFAQQDSRFQIHHRPAAGLVSALNYGLQHCNSPYIARIDADDYAYPSRLQKQLEYLERHPNLAAVGSKVRHVGDPIAQKGYRTHVEWLNGLLSPHDHYVNRFADQPLANPSTLLRSSVFEQVGPYQAGDFPEDYEFWLRCMDAGLQVAKVPEVLLDWYDLPTRATRNLDMYREDAFHQVKTHFWARWAQRTYQNPENMGLYIWGVSKQVARKSKHLISEGWSPTAYLDLTDRQSFKNRPVIHVDTLPTLPQPRHVLIYVSSRKGKLQIAKHLDSLGWQAGVDFHFMV